MLNQLRAALALALFVGGLGYSFYLIAWERQNLRALGWIVGTLLVAELVRPSAQAVVLARRKRQAEELDAHR